MTSPGATNKLHVTSARIVIDLTLQPDDATAAAPALSHSARLWDHFEAVSKAAGVWQSPAAAAEPARGEDADASRDDGGAAQDAAEWLLELAAEAAAETAAARRQRHFRRAHARAAAKASVIPARLDDSESEGSDDDGGAFEERSHRKRRNPFLASPDHCATKRARRAPEAPATPAAPARPRPVRTWQEKLARQLVVDARPALCLNPVFR